MVNSEKKKTIIGITASDEFIYVTKKIFFLTVVVGRVGNMSLKEMSLKQEAEKERLQSTQKRRSRFSLAIGDYSRMHTGACATSMLGIPNRYSQFGKSDLKFTKTMTTTRLTRLGQQREKQSTSEKRCWTESPLFRQLAGNYRSLFQIAKSADVTHLLCLPPASWCSESEISYQDVQAHLLIPDANSSAAPSWDTFRYHSLRNDGLAVDVNEDSENNISLLVSYRPVPLIAGTESPEQHTEINVFKWEKLENTTVVVLWLQSALISASKKGKRNAVKYGTTLLQLNTSFNSSVTSSGEKTEEGKPINLRDQRRYLQQLSDSNPGISPIISHMDEEILITNAHYFFPPDDLSHLTPAKTNFLCESFAGDVLSKVDGTEDEEIVEQCIHGYIIGGMHVKLLKRWIELHKDADEDFQNLCSELENLSWLEWQIPKGFRGDQERAVKLCNDLGNLRTPLEMGRALASISLAVLEDSPESDETDIAAEASADLLLPLLMRVIALSVGRKNTFPLIGCLAYIRDFGCPSMGFSNIAYAMSTFEAAAEFISSGACNDFCRSEEIEISQMG